MRLEVQEFRVQGLGLGFRLHGVIGRLALNRKPRKQGQPTRRGNNGVPSLRWEKSSKIWVRKKEERGWLQNAPPLLFGPGRSGTSVLASFLKLVRG